MFRDRSLSASSIIHFARPLDQYAALLGVPMPRFNNSFKVPDLSFSPPPDGQRLTISVLIDNKNSWVAPWAEYLSDILSPHHDADVYFSSSSLGHGDLCFVLGYTKILSPEILGRHEQNLVVHESALPDGRGWSPVQWQILEGKNNIPITLFMATEELDAGPIYLQDTIALDGTELMPEIRHKQGEKTLELILQFLERWPDIEPKPQSGTSSSYGRRTRESDRLDVNKPLAETFDQLRIVDNENYPAWFKHRGRHYLLKIFNTDDPLE